MIIGVIDIPRFLTSLMETKNIRVLTITSTMLSIYLIAIKVQFKV